MNRLVSALLMGCLTASSAMAQDGELAGRLRTWGHGSRSENTLGPLLAALEAGFQHQHPQVRFDDSLRGDDTAIGGLYTGAADMAWMERAPSAIELDAYQPIFKADPTEVTIATGSVDRPRHANALAILVHPSNPLRHLSLAQADAIFGADHRRGLSNIRRWSQLGVGGAWRSQPIHVYVPAIDGEEAQQFVKAVFAGSQKWAGELRELPDPAQAAQAVASDPFGIALATSREAGRPALALALGEQASGPFVAPDAGQLAARRYPLLRSLRVYVNRPFDPTLAAFLRYVLSDEGQDIIARDGGYYRLPPTLAAHEQEKLQ